MEFVPVQTPMRFGLIIQGAPYTAQAPATALRFANAAVASGHTVHRVFFQHEGVLLANRMAQTPGSEQPLREAWTAFSVAHGAELAVCVASCLKRGIVDETEQQRLGLAGANLDPAFTLVGLGQLVEMTVTCDRVITFAA